MSDDKLNNPSPDTSKDDELAKEYEELSELLDNALADFAPTRENKMSGENDLRNVSESTDNKSESAIKLDTDNTSDSDTKLEPDCKVADVPETDTIPKSDKPSPDNKPGSDNKPDEKQESKAGSSDERQRAFDFSWDDEFLRTAAAELEENMQILFGADELPITAEVTESFLKMSDDDDNWEESLEFDFSDVIAQTLNSLAANIDSFQAGLAEEELFALLSAFNSLKNSSTESSEVTSLIQIFMQFLLSKEMLLPSLKRLIAKYTQWLNENKSTLAEEVLEGYMKHIHLLNIISGELEKETLSESEEVKEERFRHIIQLINEIFATGQPPPELIGNNPLAEFEKDGDPKTLANILKQCNLM